MSRTESYGDYGNLVVEISEVEVLPGEQIQDAYERASQEVASRLEFEARRRQGRGKFWVDVKITRPIESYDEKSGAAEPTPPDGAGREPG